MKNKSGIIIGIVAIILLAIVAYFFLGNQQSEIPINSEDSGESTINVTPAPLDGEETEQNIDQYDTPQEIPEDK